MKRLTITVPSNPLAKKRHRTSPLVQCTGCQKKRHGQYQECPDCGGQMRFLANISYADSESVQYENLGAYCANQAMASQNVTAFTGATSIGMVFSFLIPVSRACKKHAEPTSGCKRLHPGDLHTQRPDLDNCVKSVLDFGNSIIFADDCIVAKMVAEKFWSAEGRAEILVESLEE